MMSRRRLLAGLAGGWAAPKTRVYAAMRPETDEFFYIVVVGGGAGSGVFVYSPAIGTGNLVASIAGTAGTDQYQNAYVAGIASYIPGGAGANVIQLSAGVIKFLYSVALSSPPLINAGGNGVTTLLSLSSGIGTGSVNASIFQLNDDNATPGTPVTKLKAQLVVNKSSVPVPATAAALEVQGDLDVSTAGNGLRVAEGANAKQGVATLAGGTKLVANTSVTATSRIMLTAQDNNSTGALRVSARVAGTSFTITSSNAADSGVVAWQMFEQG